MLSVEPKDISPGRTYHYMTGGIGPRPIAFVSTISKDGVNNLAPFSFFNAFSCSPPVIGFCPALKDDGSFKDTYRNLVDTGECVVQVVTYDMVEKINICAQEFLPDIDEFIESVLTPVDSDLVKPKRVKESPFQMEAKVLEIINFRSSSSTAFPKSINNLQSAGRGTKVRTIYSSDLFSNGHDGGSGNLAICEVVKFHIDEKIFKPGTDRIDPNLIDLIGRNGGKYYTRAHGEAIFEW